MPAHIGLIGGIGPAATDYYYRKIIAAFAELDAELELTLAHADAPTLLRNLQNDDRKSQMEIYTRLTNRLKNTGADFRSDNPPSFDGTNKGWLWVTASFTLRRAMPTALNSQNT